MDIENSVVKKKEPNIQFKNGVLSIIGASLINFVYPSIFSFCTLAVYQTSYVKNHGGNVNINYTMFYYPVVLFFQSIFGLIGGYINNKIEVHWSNFLGTFLVILGSFIGYISESFILDMISMAVFRISLGVIMFPATMNACKYFMKHIGLVNGIVETAISLGSTFYAFIGERIINPDEIPSRDEDNFYDDYIDKNVKTFFVVQMLSALTVFLIGLIIIKKYNEEIYINVQERLLYLTKSEDNANNEIKVVKNILTRKQKLIKALKSWKFWRFNLISLSQSPISDMVFSLYRGIGESHEINQTALQLIGTLNFIIEFILSFVFGVLCDYVNFKILLFIMNIIGTIVGFTYCLTFNDSFFFALLTLSISVQSAAYYSLKDYHIMKVFGTDIYIDLSGFVCLFTGITVIILTFITYWVEEVLVEKNKAYWIMFTIFGGLNGLGVILGFFEDDEPFDYGEN